VSEWLKWLVAGKELRALNRYRKACHLAYRWNGNVPNSAETAEWIQAVGEDLRGADIEQFRERLRNNAKATRPAPSDEDVEAAAKRIAAADGFEWQYIPKEKIHPTYEGPCHDKYRRMARAALGARGE